MAFLKYTNKVMTTKVKLYKDDWVLGGCEESERPEVKSYTHPEVVSAYCVRPTYPDEIIQRIMKKFNSIERPSDTVALDVGCGSGQFSRILAPHFSKVIGIDPSEPQIALAKEDSQSITNIEYRLGTCYNLGVPDQSVDLITVGTAIHRFTEIDKFLSEVDRCLKPGGVFSYFGQNDKASGDLCKANQIWGNYTYGKENLGPYWSSSVNTIVIDEYSTIPKLYEDTENLQIDQILQFTVDNMVKYVQSMEPYGVLKEKDPLKLDRIMNSLLADLKLAFPSSGKQNGHIENSFDFQMTIIGCICQKPMTQV